MPYLIDGHNLIPRLPGLSLDIVDDEDQLIQRLQVFCQRQQKNAEVFFDRAPVGEANMRRFGRVTAHFVHRGRTADEAIRSRLVRLKGAARNWTVVSSDRQVRAAARSAGARVLSAAEFARLLQKTLDEAGNDPEALSDAEIPPDEIDDWLALFGAEGEE